MIKKSKFVIVAFVIFCILYLLRYQAYLKTEYIPNKNYSITGRITSIKKVSDSEWRVKLGPFWADLGQKPHGKLGDEIQAIGRIDKRVINDFYHEFWLINLEIEQIKPLSFSSALLAANSWLFLRLIADFRSLLEGIGSRLLPEPQSALLLGIVLGSQQQVSSEFYEALRQSGTLHIIVASGMNVTILGKVVLSLMLKRFRRGWAVSVSLVCILIYTFLAGSEPPIVRAAIMGSVAFTAQVFGRQYWAGWALFLAAAGMVLLSPGQLFQIGFQLSLSATAGLLFVSPWLLIQIEKIIGRFQTGAPLLARVSNLIKTDLVETTSAQLAVFPLLMTYFGQFNLLAVIPNILVGFLVPVLMRWGGGLFFVGLIWEQLARLAALIVWVPLTYMAGVIELFGRLDWFIIQGEWPWWAVGGYWVGLVVLIRSNSRGRREVE